jgi:hypothetical protein
MAPKQRQEPGPPLTLGNMRLQGVHHLIAYCLNDSCRHQAIIDVSSYPGDTPVPWFQGKVKKRSRGCLTIGGGAQPGKSDPIHRALPADDQPHGADRAAMGL